MILQRPVSIRPTLVGAQTIATGFFGGVFVEVLIVEQGQDREVLSKEMLSYSWILELISSVFG